MRCFRTFSIATMSAFVGLMVVSCMMTLSPMREEDARAQTLSAVVALQTAWQQVAPDANVLQSHAASIRDRLTVLCSPYLPLEEQLNATTTPLIARQARTPVAP